MIQAQAFLQRQDGGDSQSSGTAREAGGEGSSDNMTTCCSIVDEQKQERQLGWEQKGRHRHRKRQSPHQWGAGAAWLPSDWQRKEWRSQDGSMFRANDKFIIRESEKAQWPSKKKHAAMQKLAWRNYRLTRK